MNTIKKDRLIILTAVFAILLVVYLVFLYKLQIIEGEAYYKESRNQQVTTSTVVAARGNILDRYGRVIVSNKSSYDLTINESELFPSDDSVDSNATILKLVKLIREYGEDYIDELPITTSLCLRDRTTTTTSRICEFRLRWIKPALKSLPILLTMRVTSTTDCSVSTSTQEPLPR